MLCTWANTFPLKAPVGAGAADTRLLLESTPLLGQGPPAPPPAVLRELGGSKAPLPLTLKLVSRLTRPGRRPLGVLARGAVSSSIV